jgi:hypothetical protein
MPLCAIRLVWGWSCGSAALDACAARPMTSCRSRNRPCRHRSDRSPCDGRNRCRPISHRRAQSLVGVSRCAQVFFTKVITMFVRAGVWSRYAGPEPGMLGCRAPGELLAKHGIDAKNGEKLRKTRRRELHRDCMLFPISGTLPVAANCEFGWGGPKEKSHERTDLPRWSHRGHFGRLVVLRPSVTP